MSANFYEHILIFHVRASKRKSMDLAIIEAKLLFENLGVSFINGGPMSEKSGVFCMGITDEQNINKITDKSPRLGYTHKLDVAYFNHSANNKNGCSWKGKYYDIYNIYSEDVNFIRAKSPDMRDFIILDHEGNNKKIKGYRGDGGITSKRGLSVADSKLLVNLVYTSQGKNFLDPFAGGAELL